MNAMDIEVPAIYEEDIKRILNKLGILEEITQGKAKCFICDKKISLDNFGGVVKIKGNLKVLCDDPICIETAIEITEALKGSE